MFDESSLPEWATRENTKEDVAASFALGQIDFVGNLETKPQPNMDSMARIDSEFKAAVKTAKDIEATPMPTLLDNKVADTLKTTVRSGVATGAQAMQPAVMSMKATAQTLKDKLVATAEDLLKAQGPSQSGGTAGSPVKPPGTEIKRVLFPRIEK
jgi:hypothetical protein